MNLETKTCQHCNTEFTRFTSTGRRRSDTDWNKQTYCSRSCSLSARRGMAITRPCAACGNPYTVPAAKYFQKTCSHTCGTIYAVMKGKAEKEPAVYVEIDGVRRRCSVCDCGEPATTSVHFYTLNAMGYKLAQSLPVCPSCRDYMLETDPGCNAVPLPETKERSLGYGEIKPSTPQPTAHRAGAHKRL